MINQDSFSHRDPYYQAILDIKIQDIKKLSLAVQNSKAKTLKFCNKSRVKIDCVTVCPVLAKYIQGLKKLFENGSQKQSRDAYHSSFCSSSLLHWWTYWHYILRLRLRQNKMTCQQNMTSTQDKVPKKGDEPTLQENLPSLEITTNDCSTDSDTPDEQFPHHQTMQVPDVKQRYSTKRATILPTRHQDSGLTVTHPYISLVAPSDSYTVKDKKDKNKCYRKTCKHRQPNDGLPVNILLIQCTANLWFQEVINLICPFCVHALAVLGWWML